jgi:sigma-E factor negative regulatory protein RseB
MRQQRFQAIGLPLGGLCARVAALTLLAGLFYAPTLRAEDAGAFLARAATAARQLNYIGTIVFQHGGRVETSRLTHLNDGGVELEKLINLDGPAREVIRSAGEVRCYYPDAKIVRVEPRTFRNVFPSLSPEQQQALAQYYDFRRGETARVAGLEAQTYVFEPRDGLRYGHKFWADAATGLLLKARIVDEKGEVIEQFAFTDLAIGARIDREMVKPSWAGTPADWQLKQGGSAGDAVLHDTGWVVNRVPPGFAKIGESFRLLRGKREPVAHLVYSDGLVAVSVFIEPLSTTPPQAGFMQQGGLNVYTLRLGDYLVTVLGEAPARTVQQIAYSVARR